MSETFSDWPCEALPYSSTRVKHTQAEYARIKILRVHVLGNITEMQASSTPRSNVPRAPLPRFHSPITPVPRPLLVSSPLDIRRPPFSIHHLKQSSRQKFHPQAKARHSCTTMKPTFTIILFALLATAMALPTAKQPNMFPAEDKSESATAGQSMSVCGLMDRSRKHFVP